MHQALLVPEVLLEIFAHVTEVILKPFGPARFIVVVLYRESLAALATTCRAFHEPAMDLLWDEIEIESLLGCVTRLHPLIYCSGRLVSTDQLISYIYWLIEHAHSGTGQKASGPYLPMKSINFCVTPPVFVH
jgi:hypothetical protein